jgi:aminoglycoside/choline kinase family phosphotransferase
MTAIEPDLLVFLEKTAALMHLPEGTPEGLVLLAGDGSTRRIYRVPRAGLPVVVVVNPLPPERAHPDENESFLAVGAFLERRGVRVPRFYAADLEHGYLLLEDLGDKRLHDCVREAGWPQENHAGGQAGAAAVFKLYEHALRMLIAMQAPGQTAFRSEWVFNPPYTQDFIIEMEAAYFHEELVCGLAGSAQAFGEIEPECRFLARKALGLEDAREGPGAPTPAHHCFMHRDFQSRNLMILDATLAVIDFQGGRLGPPEYDLAALLYDPYVAMPAHIRLALAALYQREAFGAGVRGIPRPDEAAAGMWRERFLANAANRLMQALGAYAKLGGRLGRPGFREHIPQALQDLEGVLAALDCCPRLHALAGNLRKRAWPS